MSAAAQGNEITLSGPPRNMAAVIPLDVPGDAVIPISLNVGGQLTIFRASVRPYGRGRSEVRLRLPVDTPAGTYTGEATLGGKQRAIAAQVEPVMRIRVQPKQTHLSAAASSGAEFGLTVSNGGNMPFDVPKAAVFDLDDAAGQDRALGRTLRAPLSEGERRVDRFFDELRESHGGEANVAVRVGAGRLEPGESRELTCFFEAPATAQAGRSYLGAWEIGNSAHVIVADITTSTRPRNGRIKA